MKEAFLRQKSALASLGAERGLIFINFAAIFLPFFVSAFTVGLSALLILFTAKRRSRLTLVPRTGWLLAWAALTVAVGLAHRNFYGIAPALLFFLFIVFALYAATVTEPCLTEAIADLTVAASVAELAAACVQKLLTPSMRTAAAFYNPNYYGFLCELTFLLCLYAAIRRGGLHACLWYGAGMAASLGGVVLSGCRSAWFAILTGILILLLAMRKYKAFFSGLALTLLCSAAVLLFPSVFVPRASTFGETTSLRVLIWKTAVGAFLKHPLLGEGFLTYHMVTTGRAHRAHAHDLLLDCLVNFGLIGTALALLFLVPAMISWAKRAKKEPVCALALGLMAATLIHGITDVPVLGYQTGSMLMILLALAGPVGAAGAKVAGGAWKFHFRIGSGGKT